MPPSTVTMCESSGMSTQRSRQNLTSDSAQGPPAQEVCAKGQKETAQQGGKLSEQSDWLGTTTTVAVPTHKPQRLYRLRQQPDVGSCFRCERCGFLGASRHSISMHMAQAHRPKLPYSLRSSRCVAARLFRLLQALAPESRRRVLQNDFSQQQRLELEQWLLGSRSRDGKAGRKDSNSVDAVSKQGDAQHTVGARCEQRGHSRKRACDDVSSKEDLNDKPSWASAPRMFHGQTASKPHHHARCNDAGRQCKKVMVRQHLTAAAVNFHARLVQDPGKEQLFMAALRAMAARFVAVVDPMISGSDCSLHLDTQETVFMDAVQVVAAIDSILRNEARRLGLDAEHDMRVCISICVPAGYWIGADLRTPRYHLSQLPAAVDALLSLCRSRGKLYTGRTNRHSILSRHSPGQIEEAWLQLREAYLNAWAAAGRCDISRVEARLNEQEVRHQAFRQRLCARWKEKQFVAGTTKRRVLMRPAALGQPTIAVQSGAQTVVLTPTSTAAKAEEQIRALLRRFRAKKSIPEAYRALRMTRLPTRLKEGQKCRSRPAFC
mmetsp:Transcript_31545/g.69576  ORF Transcript_31545/g.69576 Transcript_31545/m.69576 type:complete len:548 (+) Transcript_31545:243-1886(+)